MARESSEDQHNAASLSIQNSLPTPKTQEDSDLTSKLDEKASTKTNVIELNSTLQSPEQPTTVSRLRHAQHVLLKFAKFIGPGAIISVAYIDPDNYQTAVSAGAEFKYKLLFMILLSNIIAIYLQALAAKLGCVTGMNLAEMNRAHLPRWANIALWLLAEAAIVCTDVGQVIGTAIAINLLIPKIPLIAGCALSVVDALFILFFYRPDGKLNVLRAFEFFIAAVVTGVFICFCIELSHISASAGEVFKGFLPSKTVFVSSGLYQSCAILGGTIMPHSIYLGSGIVQSRLRDFDVQAELCQPASEDSDSLAGEKYRPSLRAIRSCMSYTIVELCLTLFIIAVFINSAILIVAGSSLSEAASDADLFGMYDLFKSSISQSAATTFAVGLLFSGTTAGVVATLAGQLVMEGAMRWRMNPFLRRLITRLVAVIPGMIIAAAEGRNGLAAALNGCNVVLSVALIFITAPLVWFTSRRKYMLLLPEQLEETPAVTGAQDVEQSAPEEVSLENNTINKVFAGLTWLLIVVLNIATLVLLGLGLGDD